MEETDIITELNKIKVVLLALWDNQNHPDAQKIVEKFKEETDEITGN